MKNLSLLVTAFLCFVILPSCDADTKLETVNNYKPDSQALHDSIVQLDSLFFAAYNNCDLQTMASLIAEDIEFYHDQGGLMTSKDSIMLATENNICGKVTRVLVAGSMEVYPIAGYGAVQIGEHYFINNREPKPDHPSIGKFVHTWKKENNNWKITRVISLH